ncbi:hypothetical protein ScPMuIL_015286 [Solemya velum]
MGCVCGREDLTINNRKFYIKSRIGEGGFSYIDLIEDANNRRLFALKRISCHSKEDERVAMQEVEIMKTFHHQNLIALEESAMVSVGYHSKTLDITCDVLIAMPYYRKGSLQDKMEILRSKGEKMPEDYIWNMFIGTCHGLRALHSHNPPYAHRDVKPANVMISDDNNPVLMDLGSAAKARVETNTSSECRSLQDQASERCSMLFRAPELFNVDLGANIDERTDIWSLGCVLYGMAYLESPFEKIYQRGDSIALAVLGCNIKFPDFSGYSGHVNEIIQWLMTVNIAERPFIDEVIAKVETICINKV